MSSIRKKIKQFLSGKDSPEGKSLYDAWYSSFNDAGAPEALNPAEVERELKRIKKRPVHHDVIPADPLPYWRVAAAIVFLTVSSVYLYRFINRPQSPADYQAYHTAAGERQRIVLTDGTQVWLNAGSELRAPKTFRGNTRQVLLSGEAYFDVARNEKKPFVIHAGELTTTVLGTVFNVRNYTEQHPEVAVVSGKVSVTYKAHSVVLTRGRKAALSNGTLTENSFTDFDLYSGWKDGKLVLENRPVTEVLQTVSRFYGVDIRIKGDELGSCPVSTTLEPMTEKDLVDLLCLLLNATAQKEGTIYWLSGSGCN